jgi:glycine oxidase
VIRLRTGTVVRSAEARPGVLELEVEELLAGLRPATPDNVPAIGPGALEGLYWATGHHRNGILLSGLTGELAAAALCGERLPDWAAPTDARRFAGAPTARRPATVEVPA